MAALLRHLVGATLEVSKFAWFDVCFFCSLRSVWHEERMAGARVGYNGFYQRTTNKRFTQLLQFFDNSSAWSQDFGGMKIRIAFLVAPVLRLSITHQVAIPFNR